MINRRISRRKAIAGMAATGAASAFPAPFLSAQEPKAKIRLGVVPLISSGPIFVAQARNFFDRVNLEVDVRIFADGALAIPALVAGELDATVSTANAGLFNTVARGAPFRLTFDRGVEKPGSGTMQLVVSNEMHKAGVTSIKEFAKLKGKKALLQAVGGVDQYLIGRALEKVGLDPISAINWQPGLAYPDIVKAMGAGQCDVAQIPVPLGMIAERNNAGKMIEAGYDVEPNMQLAGWAMPVTFLKSNMSAAIRFAMVHTHAARLYNKAAAAKDPDVIKIIHNAIKVPEPIIQLAAPRWTWFNEDASIDTASVINQGRFWQKMKLAPAGDLKPEQIFDLTPAREAAKRLAEKNPFI